MRTGSNAAGVRTLPMFGPIPTRISAIEIPTPDDSDAQTSITVEAMARNIGTTVYSPEVSRAVTLALRGAGGANPSEREKANAIFNWIKHKVRFVQDSVILEQGAGVSGVDEALIAPDRLLTMPKPVGDCDDFTQLASAMLWRAGIKNSIVTIAADPQDQQRFSHVYGQVETSQGEEIAFDSSHGPRMGWEAPRYFRRKVWRVMPYKGNLDQQVVNGKANDRFYQRRMIDPVNQQVVKAIPGFHGMPNSKRIPGMGDMNYDASGNLTTNLGTGMDTGGIFGGAGPSVGGTSWGTYLQNITSVFAGPLATAVSASIMPSGTVLQTSAKGTTLVTGSQGQQSSIASQFGVGTTGTGTLLLLGGAAILGVLLISSMNK